MNDRPTHDVQPASTTSIPALFVRLLNETTELISAELDLVKVEARDRARRAGDGLIPSALFLGLLIVGLNALGAAAVVLLGDLFGGRYALSSFVVAVVAFVACAVAMGSARRHFESAIELNRELGAGSGSAAPQALEGRNGHTPRALDGGRQG